jgi:hypothetical protein
MKTLARLGVILVAAAFVWSCAGNPQVKLVKGGQTVTGLLRTAQTAENVLCDPDPAQPTHCRASLPPLTSAQLDTAHQRIAGAFVVAFKDDLAFANAAKTWTPAAGSIKELATLKADVDSVLASVKTLPLSDKTKAAIDAAQTVVDAVLSLIQIKGVA